jgi:hypothetical protein
MNKIFLFFFLFLIINHPVKSEDFIANKTIPSGFETISEEFKISLVEYYVGGIKVGVFKTTHNKMKIKILDSVGFMDILVKKIPIIKEKINIIKDELLSNKKTNYDYVCYENCSFKLEVKKIEFIFDKNKLTAQIKINPDYFDELLINKNANNSILNNSDSGSSFMSKVNVSYFDILDDQKSIEYNLNIDTKYSLNNNRLNMQWNIHDSKVNINNISLETDFDGNEFSLGFLQSSQNGYSQSNSQNFIGFHYGTSYNTRMDLKNPTSNPIKILLSEDSLVKIYKDEKLVYVGNHKIGNNQLFIEKLPFGSYKLKIIKTSLGGIEEEYVNHTKTNLNLPKDEFIWSFDAGRISNNKDNGLPSLTEDIFINLSLAKKINDNIAMYADISKLEDELMLTPSFYFINGDFSANTSFLISNLNKTEKNIRLSYNKKDYNFEIIFQDFQNIEYIENIKSIEDHKSLGFSSNYNFDDYGNVSFNFERTKEYDDFDNYYNLTYRNQIYNNNSGNLNLSLFYDNKNKENNVGISLTYNFKNNDYSYKANSRYSKRNKKEDFKNSLSVKREKRRKYDKYGFEISLAKDNNVEVNNILYNYDNYDYGKLDFNVRQQKNNDINKVSYYGNIQTNSIIKDNDVLFGYNNSSRSGLMIDLSKYKSGEEFEILINGLKKGVVKSSDVQFVPLESYREYKVKILPTEESLFIKTENKIEKFSLYPGNIKKIIPKIYDYKIFFTKLLDINNKPLKNTKIITNMGYFYSDNYGFIEIEFNNEDFKILNFSCDKIKLEKRINFKKQLKCIIINIDT